jgi:hypothetical protein
MRVRGLGVLLRCACGCVDRSARAFCAEKKQRFPVGPIMTDIRSNERVVEGERDAQFCWCGCACVGGSDGTAVGLCRCPKPKVAPFCVARVKEMDHGRKSCRVVKSQIIIKLVPQ